MGNFSLFQHQKREPSATPLSSFARPAHLSAPTLLPTPRSIPFDGQASFEPTSRFRHSFASIPVNSAQAMTRPQSGFHFSQIPPLLEKTNTGLPDLLKSGIETLSGLPMDNAQVHYNSSKPAQLQALAYTQGTEIHVGPGQEVYLAHEAWHVVQQKQGRVKPTLQMKSGVHVNDDTDLEMEADVMGKAATNLVTQHRYDSHGISNPHKNARGVVEVIQFGGVVPKGTSSVGRKLAVEFTEKYAKPRLGFLIHEAVKPFAYYLGDIASGTIGQHYMNRAADLEKNVTKRGIIKFAIKETRWWNQQKGIPGFVGSLMSKNMRAALLIAKAIELGLLNKDEKIEESKSKEIEENTSKEGEEGDTEK